MKRISSNVKRMVMERVGLLAKVALSGRRSGEKTGRVAGSVVEERVRVRVKVRARRVEERSLVAAGSAADEEVVARIEVFLHCLFACIYAPYTEMWLAHTVFISELLASIGKDFHLCLSPCLRHVCAKVGGVVEWSRSFA